MWQQVLVLLCVPFCTYKLHAHICLGLAMLANQTGLPLLADPNAQSTTDQANDCV
jgi:hypothetical protein